MTPKAPEGAHGRRQGRCRGDYSKQDGLQGTVAWELTDKLEIRDRLQAIIDELDRLDADVDVPRTLAEGLLEEIDETLTDHGA